MSKLMLMITMGIIIKITWWVKNWTFDTFKTSKGLLPRIYKKVLQTNQKERENPVEKRAKTMKMWLTQENPLVLLNPTVIR